MPRITKDEAIPLFVATSFVLMQYGLKFCSIINNKYIYSGRLAVNLSRSVIKPPRDIFEQLHVRGDLTAKSEEVNMFALDVFVTIAFAIGIVSIRAVALYYFN